MANLKALTQEKNIELSVEKSESAELNECPVATAIDVIGGKWKVIILYQLRGKTLTTCYRGYSKRNK